jgi:hypothetical protein
MHGPYILTSFGLPTCLSRTSTKVVSYCFMICLLDTRYTCPWAGLALTSNFPEYMRSNALPNSMASRGTSFVVSKFTLLYSRQGWGQSDDESILDVDVDAAAWKQCWLDPQHSKQKSFDQMKNHAHACSLVQQPNLPSKDATKESTMNRLDPF